MCIRDRWKGRESLISTCSRLILSDFSDGMVETTKEIVGDYAVSYTHLDVYKRQVGGVTAYQGDDQ